MKLLLSNMFLKLQIENTSAKRQKMSLKSQEEFNNSYLNLTQCMDEYEKNCKISNLKELNIQEVESLIKEMEREVSSKSDRVFRNC